MKTNFSKMLTVLIFACIVIFTVMIFVVGCKKQMSTHIEGAWNLVGIDNFSGGKCSKYPRDFSGSDMKIWSKGYFIFVGRFKVDTTFIDNYGGGTYKLDGIKYEETVLYHANKNWVNTKPKMTLEVKSDTLYLTYPVGDDWKFNSNKDYAVEKYIRFK